MNDESNERYAASNILPELIGRTSIYCEDDKRYYTEYVKLIIDDWKQVTFYYNGGREALQLFKEKWKDSRKSKTAASCYDANLKMDLQDQTAEDVEALENKNYPR